MKKNVLLFALVASLLMTGCSKKKTNENETDDLGEEFSIVLDENNQIDGGSILKDGIFFHFDENSVIEHPTDSFVEIGPYGSLYLENHVPGIKVVRVTARHTIDYSGSFFLGKSSTPNSVEVYSLYSETSLFVNLNDDYPFFSIHNREGNILIIDTVEITGISCCDPEKDLKDLLTVSDKVVSYQKNVNVDPYDEIDESKIPSTRIVKKIDEGRIYNEPGEFAYGYEVYSKTKDGNTGKLLFTSKAELTIKGSTNNRPLAIFHLPERLSILEVNSDGTLNLESDSDLLKYNWENKINDFTTPITSDRHFYPEFSVVGIPSNKNADGCFNAYTTYSSFDGVIDMPEPVMKDGYKFGGWFLDYDLTKPFDKDNKYNFNLTLYAKCIETNDNFRKIYYRDYDGTFLNRIDYLYENNFIDLPKFDEIHTSLDTDKLMYEVRVGPNRINMVMPEHDYINIYGRSEHYNGDKLTYEMVKEYDGDITLYVSKFEFYDNGPAQFTRIFSDFEQNTVITGVKMFEEYHEGDFVLPGRYVEINKQTGRYDFNTFSDLTRTDDFLITDEVHGYIADQGSFNSISSYGYGNKSEIYSKPLNGIVRHDSVLKVGRRAFFNRYGLQGTYFPKYAREFDIESYANTHFNENLLLPKNLIKIGNRAFMGSKNIKNVVLPKTLTTVGKGAFSIGKYNEDTTIFEDIRYRTNAEKINFYYEGSEEDFAKLSTETKNEILNNANKIIYDFTYNPYYGK